MKQKLILSSIIIAGGLFVYAQNKPVASAAPKSAFMSSLNPGDIGTLNFKTNIGSFRFRDGIGRIEMTFTGTLLISNLEGTATVTGNVRKEYPRTEADKKHKRELYFGTGKLVLEGKFRTVQWFGSNLSGKWTGLGVANLYGEFDKNLYTGQYWFENEVKNAKYWSPYGSTVLVPGMKEAGSVKPKVKIN